MKKVTEDLKWEKIDHEKYRIYVFPNGETTINIEITNPILINVSKSGGHRILDANDISHYIPFKWIHFYFETNDDVAWRF